MKKQLFILGIIALLVSVGLSGCNTSNPPEKTNDWINAGGTRLYSYDNGWEIMGEEGHWKLQWECIQGNGFHAKIYDDHTLTQLVHSINSEDNSGTVLFDVYYPSEPGSFYLVETSGQTDGIWEIQVWYQYF